MIERFLAWRKERVRYLFRFGPAPLQRFYLVVTPRLCLSVPLSHPQRRLRIGRLHGVQIVEWGAPPGRPIAWYVRRQLFGESKVEGADHLATAMRVDL